MATLQLYKRDQFELSANTVVTESSLADDGCWCVCTAATTFFPGGGGQAGDVGRITGAFGNVQVRRTVLRPDGTIEHIGDLEGRLGVGEPCKALVNPAIRTMNSRLHSAGELLCAAVEHLMPGTPIVMANHRLDQASITLGVALSPAERGPLGDALAEEVSRMIKAKVSFRVDQFDSRDEAAKFCGFRPEIEDVPIRLVFVGDFFVRPCCGTHVGNAWEVGGLRVRSMDVRKGKTRIGYDLFMP